MRRVALVIATRDGLVLFGRRRDNGKYTLPGGHLNEGEDPKDGARRELLEETGLEPKGELKLIDERVLRDVQFYTFECEVDGVPTGKHDPDQECGTWGFFDISKGVPKDMAESMAGPKEKDKNIVKDLYGIAKAEKTEWPALMSYPQMRSHLFRHTVDEEEGDADADTIPYGQSYNLHEIPIDKIGASPHDPRKVQAYASMSRESAPPVVLETGSTGVFSGHHRVAAAKARGDKTVLAYVPQDYQRSGIMSGHTCRFCGGMNKSEDLVKHDTPEFRQWFEGSHVKDPSTGKPMPVYHGTSKDQDFSTFKIGERGAWFTTDPEEAGKYAHENDSQDLKYNYDTREFDKVNQAPRVIPAYLALKNPYKMKPEDLDEHRRAPNYRRFQAQLARRVKLAGHDGIDFGDGTYVAFHPHQIKSIFNSKPTQHRAMNKAEDGPAAPAAPKPKRTKKVAQPQPQPEHNLVGVHNLTAPNVLHAHELNGLIAPSLAVTHKDYPLDGFGEISLVANNHLIDPRQTPVFDADIYSPRHPRAKYRVNHKNLGEFQKWIQPHAKAVDAYFGDAEHDIGRQGEKWASDDYRRRRALGHAFLHEKGALPEVPRKPKRFPWVDMHAMQEFKAKNPRESYRYRDEPGYEGFREAAHKAIRQYADDQFDRAAKAGIDMGLDHDELVESFTKQMENTPHSRLIQDVDNDAPDEPDPYRFGEAIEEQLKNHPDFERWMAEKTKPVIGDRYLPKYIDTRNGPDERQVPYTPENILKEMTRNVRSGEGFNYGLGNARAKGAKQFRDIAEMTADRHKIVPKAEFEKHKAANEEEFNQLTNQIQRYHEDGSGYRVMEALSSALGESLRRGKNLATELRREGFSNVPPKLQQKIAEFGRKLVATPTEYFEAKPQRIVHLGEFKGAAVPHDVDPAVLEALRHHGIEHIEHYNREDQAARAEAIKRIANAHNLYLGEMPMTKAQQTVLQMPSPAPKGQEPERGVAGRQHPDSPEFHNWFNGSHVVDHEGKPRVVFHGTRADFSSFDPSTQGTATEAPSARLGFFFSGRAPTAETYTNVVLPHEKEAHDAMFGEAKRLASKHWRYHRTNPKTIERSKADYARSNDLFHQAYEMRTQGANIMPVYLSLKNPYHHDMKGKPYRDESYHDIIQRAQAAGHDGVIIHNTFDAGNMGDGEPDHVYVAFHPHQIKSAIGNRGAFDPNNPEITKAEDDDVEVLIKMQRIPGFARLGIEDRRETPFIDTPGQVRHKTSQLAWAFKPDLRAVLKPGIDESIVDEFAREKAGGYMENAAGAVHNRPQANVSFAYTNNASNNLGLPGVRGDKTDVGTKLHEDFHQMMRRVQMKYGPQARENLAHNLWYSVPFEQRHHAQQYASDFNKYLPDGHKFKNEEHLAILHNYVNDKTMRDHYHKKFGHDSLMVGEHHHGIRRAFRQMIQNARNVDESWLLHKKFGPGANEPKGTKPGGYVVPAPQDRERIGPKPAPPRNPEPAKPAAQKPKVVKKPKVNPDQLDLFKGVCGWANAFAYGESLNKSIKHDDEVDRLLMHPNPIERRMALKMDGVGEHHLVRALADEDPQVQRAAMKHPQFGHHALLALMQMPDRTHLQLLGLHHPDAGRAHLEALYHTHKDRPVEERGEVMRAISNHHALDGGLIEKMVEDGNGARVIENLHTPQHVIEKVIEEHFLDPQHPQKKALARRALRHPNVPLDLVREAFENGPNDVKLSVAMGPHLDEAQAQDVLQRGQLPQHDDEAYLRGAIVGNEKASKRHLETATKDRNAIVREHAKRRLGDFSKFQEDLSKWLGEKLAKATRPQDFRAVAGAIKGGEGHQLVDHKPELKAHPPAHNHDIEAYRQTILDSPEVVKRKSGSKHSEGITRKLVYEVPATHPTHGGVKYMVKPYHERPIARVKEWAKTPHQGWAEMTNQALYHAAGIGHLHQKVHVAEHNMGEGHEAEPALVVRMDPDFEPHKPFSDGVPSVHSPSSLHEDGRKVAIMDFLTNNLDRHQGNLLYGGREPDPGTGRVRPTKLLAIDHSRSFQYHNGHNTKWKKRREQPRELQDYFSDYVNSSALRGVAPLRYTKNGVSNDYEALQHWAPAFDWWGENADAVKRAFGDRLNLIKDPEVRKHLARNFFERANWLDDRAYHGLENFGTDWYNYPVDVYRPGEKPHYEE